jgi:site-specific DNA-methyltransferase (adenine-specific)
MDTRTDLYLGDCLDKLKQMKDNSVDTIITDPPYGYSFMSKDWDKSLPNPEIFKQCYRVIKPGGFMCVMSAPRTDVYWRMCQMIENAGFEVDFTPIIWAYASGFPKALNVSKAIDKRLGVEREVLGVRHDGMSPTAMKPDKGWNDNNMGSEIEITKATSPEAIALDGSYGGFQPKPAVEMIIVAMKSMTQKTYVDQAMNNGKGVSWFDDCRIPYQNEDDRLGCKVGFGKESEKSEVYELGHKEIMQGEMTKGRFPANLLVSDDSLNDGQIHKGQAGATTGKEPSTQVRANVYGDYTGQGKPSQPRGDEGSFSRYFDLDMWFKTRFAILPKASTSEKNIGCEDLEVKKMEYEDTTRVNKETADKYGCERKSMGQNNHPTVKPIKLMSYLITMFSREGDIVVDPFMGSGTTGVSAIILNRKFIGCELDKNYMTIAKARLLGADDELEKEIGQIPTIKPKDKKPKMIQQEMF